MEELIKRSDAIDALNECEDIKGHSYTQMHDALMEIPSVDIPHSDDWEKYSERLWQKAYERGKADRPSAVDLSSVYSTAYKNGYEKGKADRPQGKWIEPKNKVAVSLNQWICSNCNYLIDGRHNYCPNCGARMKGADDEC